MFLILTSSMYRDTNGFNYYKNCTIVGEKIEVSVSLNRTPATQTAKDRYACPDY